MEAYQMADKVVKLQPDELTPLQRRAQLIKEQAELDATIKEAALRKANEAIEELKSIELDYELVEKSAVVTTSRAEASGPCPICKFETSPHHDGRNHPRKGDKLPFTDEELKQRNLVRV